MLDTQSSRGPSRSTNIRVCVRRMLFLVAAQTTWLFWPASAAYAQSDRCSALALPDTAAGATFEKPIYEAATRDRAGGCGITGKIQSSPTSAINFRIDLPDAAAWNGKLLYLGGGGFDGSVPTAAGRRAIAPAQQAYVVTSSDSGHQARGSGPFGSALDFSWAAHNPSAVRNHAFEANHLVLWVAVAAADAYYGREPAQRYMMGGSNGGRAGLVAAQRYPKDYTGIVANAPAISQEAFAANLTPLFKHIFAAPENWLGKAQVALYQKAELAACDTLDGLADGVIGNVAMCRYDPGPLACTRGQPSDACLTPGQIESVRMIHAARHVPVTMADDLVGYPGHGRGAAGRDFPLFFFGTSFAARDAVDFVLADNIIKHGITDDPNASIMTHDPTKWAGAYRRLSELIDATNPDLRAFFAGGGKLIVWHGLGDGCVSHLRTAQYLDMVQKTVGAAAYRDHVRFFTSPAKGHEAPDLDLLGPLDDWVVNGHAPQALVETNKAGVSRPLCAYPAYPRYVGKGDPAKASSFRCANPDA